MTVIDNNFDGGTDSTAMTTGNTGGASGTAFAAVEPAATFSNEWSNSGALSMKLASTAVSSYGRWVTTGKNLKYREYVNFTTAHTGDFVLAEPRITTSSATKIALVLINGANQLRLRIAATSADVWTAADPFPLNQPVRVEALFEVGTTTSDGRARIAYFLGDSLTPIEDSGWITGLNLRGDTGDITAFFIGKVSSAAYGGNAYVDDVSVRTGVDYTDSFIGPDVQALPAPTITAATPTAPTTPSGTDGQIALTWANVAEADGYDVAIQPGTVTSGFTPTATDVTSPHTFTNLPAGEYTVAVRATAG